MERGEGGLPSLPSKPRDFYVYRRGGFPPLLLLLLFPLRRPKGGNRKEGGSLAEGEKGLIYGHPQATFGTTLLPGGPPFHLHSLEHVQKPRRSVGVFCTLLESCGRRGCLLLWTGGGGWRQKEKEEEEEGAISRLQAAEEYDPGTEEETDRPTTARKEVFCGCVCVPHSLTRRRKDGRGKEGGERRRYLTSPPSTLRGGKGPS